MKQNRKQDFDFDRPDKRMPYTVPDGFFADLESRILAATVDAENKTATPAATPADTPNETPTVKHGRTLQPDTLRQGAPHPRTLHMGTLRRLLIAGVAAAAIVAVVLMPRRSEQQPVTIAEVEQVFTQLTDEDQAELLALYQNDPFLNL